MGDISDKAATNPLFDAAVKSLEDELKKGTDLRPGGQFSLFYKGSHQNTVIDGRYVLGIRQAREHMMRAMNHADPLRHIDEKDRRECYHRTAEAAANLLGYERMCVFGSSVKPIRPSRESEYWVKKQGN